MKLVGGPAPTASSYVVVSAATFDATDTKAQLRPDTQRSILYDSSFATLAQPTRTVLAETTVAETGDGAAGGAGGGGGIATVNASVVSAPTLPAPSRALTWNTYAPFARFV